MTITEGTVTSILGTVETTVLLTTDRLAVTDDDLDDCRTAPEIVSFNATQADIVLAAGQIAAALITFGPTTMARTHMPEVLSIGIGALELVGASPCVLAAHIVESARHAADDVTSATTRGAGDLDRSRGRSVVRAARAQPSSDVTAAAMAPECGGARWCPRPSAVP